jgi:hypothetical protein
MAILLFSCRLGRERKKKEKENENFGGVLSLWRKWKTLKLFC